MRKNRLLFLFLILPYLVQCQDGNKTDFNKLNQSADWHLEFTDDCTENWQSKWFLDGLLAKVENTAQGMDFRAGPVADDDAHHAVLWTIDSFSGDVKIEYKYTRTDSATTMVNILYIQATGVAPHSKDIAAWKDERIIPSMRNYFRNMKALHISYAAYKNVNDNANEDYVRARIYPVLPDRSFKEMEIPQSSFNTGLFKPGETYKITVIKTDRKLYFNVEGENDSKLFSWSLTESQTVGKGRIGLRHMYTRSSRYKDFRIYTK
jgi:hypothetical protein